MNVQNADYELEITLLASAIHNKSAMSLLMNYTDLFYFSEHRILDDILRGLWISGYPVDYSILYLELQKHGKLEQLKELYIKMAGRLISPFFQTQLNELVDLSQKRKIAEVSEKIYKQSLTRTASVKDLMSQVDDMVKEARSKEVTQFKGLDSFSVDDFKIPERVWPTGFGSVDHNISGFYGGQFIVIGARPGIGKSALALQMAVNNSSGGRALIISLEMPAKQIILRKYTSLTGIPAWKIRGNKLTEPEFEMINAAQKD